MQSNLPRLVTKVVFTGSKIVGRAFYEAGRQAYKSESDISSPFVTAFKRYHRVPSIWRSRQLKHDRSRSSSCWIELARLLNDSRLYSLMLASILLTYRVDTQYKPEGVAGTEPGSTEAAGNPSSTAGLTRMQRMTLSEAQMILNVKDEDTLEKVKQVSLLSSHLCPS
jgi:hypothetical protein